MLKRRSEKTPKISIVIPSYNKAKFISETLNSIFSQKYSNLEVVIQDGASNDGTVDIIKEFSKKYPIRWDSKKDNGQLDAVNRGLSKSTGDILSFINADDSYQSGVFEAVAQNFLLHPNALWFAGKGIVVDSEGLEIAKPVTRYKDFLLSLDRYRLLLTTNYLMQPSIFFTSKAYRKYGPFIGTKDFIMEYDFWLRLGSKQMPKVINKKLSKFRIEPSTKTKRLFNELLLEDEKIVRKYTNSGLTLLLHRANNVGRRIIGRFV